MPTRHSLSGVVCRWWAPRRRASPPPFGFGRRSVARPRRPLSRTTPAGARFLVARHSVARGLPSHTSGVSWGARVGAWPLNPSRIAARGILVRSTLTARISSQVCTPGCPRGSPPLLLGVAIGVPRVPRGYSVAPSVSQCSREPVSVDIIYLHPYYHESIGSHSFGLAVLLRCSAVAPATAVYWSESRVRRLHSLLTPELSATVASCAIAATSVPPQLVRAEPLLSCFCREGVRSHGRPRPQVRIHVRRRSTNSWESKRRSWGSTAHSGSSALSARRLGRDAAPGSRRAESLRRLVGGRRHRHAEGSWP